MAQLCKHCKRDAGSRPIRYFDIESNITYTYHADCFYGPVREAVIEEYVMFIMRVAGQRRKPWIAPS